MMLNSSSSEENETPDGKEESSGVPSGDPESKPLQDLSGVIGGWDKFEKAAKGDFVSIKYVWVISFKGNNRLKAMKFLM